MRLIIFLLLTVFCVRAFGQTTAPDYPLPKPLPSSGQLPASFVKPGGPVGQTAYDDRYTVTYDVLMNGGWRSMASILERDVLGDQYRKEGMAVYVAANKQIYILGADLLTWTPLGTAIGGGGASGPTIYTGDGSLTGNRLVDAVGHSLAFRNINSYLVESQVIDLRGPLGFTVVTPSINAGTAKAGDVLTFLGSQADFRTPPANQNIYTTDGTLNGNRLVNLGGSTITWLGPGRFVTSQLLSFSLAGSQDSTVSSAGQLTLQGSGKINMRTPNVIAGRAKPGDMAMLTDGGGGFDFFTFTPPAGAGTIEYSGNATYNNPTTTYIVSNPSPPYTGVAGAEYPDFTRFIFRLDVGNADSPKAQLGVGPSRPILTPAGAALPAGNVPTGSITECVYDAVRQAWILLDYTVSGGGSGGGDVTSINGLTGAVIIGAGPGISVTPDSGNTIRINNTSGPTIYNGDGVLSSNRIVNAAGFDLSFTNAKSFDARGATSVIAGVQNMRLLPPKVAAGNGVIGNVATLKALDGSFEFDPIPPSVNIYNSDGTLSGNRTLNGGGRDLTMSSLGKFSLAATSITNNASRIDLISTGMSFLGSSVQTWLYSDIIDLKGTNVIDMSSGGHLGFIGKDVDLTGNTVHFGSSGEFRTTAQNITNYADRIDLIGTNITAINGVNSLNLTSKAINLSGTNSIYASTPGPLTLYGGATTLAGNTSLALAAGVNLTNSAPTVNIVGTNTITLQAWSTLNLDGATTDIEGTNGLTLRSSGQAYLTGSPVTVLSPTTMTLTSSGVATLGSGSTLNLDGATTDIEGTNNLTLRSTGTAYLTGNPVQVTSPGTMNLNASSWINIASSGGVISNTAPSFRTTVTNDSYLDFHGTGKYYVTADGIDMTATNNFNLDGASQFTMTGANLDAGFTGHAVVGASGDSSLIAGNSLTNRGKTVTIIATNGFYMNTPRMLAGLVKPGDQLTLTPSNTVDFVTSLSSSGLLQVTNVASLITVPCGTNGPYKYVQTSGYYSVGDGGGALYYVSPYSSSLTNYGNFRSSADPNQMWNLLAPREGIFLRQYGAKGDGLSDDTLMIQSWLNNLNGVPGKVSAGVYLTSGNTLPDTVLTLYGVQPVGNSPMISNMGGQSVGNAAIFRRKAGSAGHLFSSAAGSANFNSVLRDLVFDGNVAADSANATSYLLLIQSGNTKGSYLSGIICMNSGGYGVAIAGMWNITLENFEISTVKQRALRLSNSYRCKIRHGLIYNCEEYGINVTSSSAYNTFDDIRVTDCGLDGILIDGCNHNKFSNMQVWGPKRSAIRFSNASAGVEYITFSDCSFVSANAQVNAATGVAASPTATWPYIYVDSATSSLVYHINFKDSEFGGWGAGVAPSPFTYGTNEVSNIFKWVGANTLQPWDRWAFVDNDYKSYSWNYNPATYSPAADKRDRVIASGTRENSDNTFDIFNSAGSLNRTDGLTLESVPSAPSNQPLQVSATAHNITTTGSIISPKATQTIVPQIIQPPPWNPNNP